MSEKRIGIYVDSHYFSKIYHHYLSRRSFDIQELILSIREILSNSLKTDLESCITSEIKFYIGAKSFAEKVDLINALKDAGVGIFSLREFVKGEDKGVAVCLALDAYKSVVADNYDVLAIICEHPEFIPLVEDVRGELNKDVFLFYWDIGNTKTAEALINSATGAFPMHEYYPKIK